MPKPIIKVFIKTIIVIYLAMAIGLGSFILTKMILACMGC